MVGASLLAKVFLKDHDLYTARIAKAYIDEGESNIKTYPSIH